MVTIYGCNIVIIKYLIYLTGLCAKKKEAPCQNLFFMINYKYLAINT